MLTKRLLDLTLPKRSPTCSECGEKFTPGAVVTSNVLQEEEYVRCDYCANCWERVGEAKQQEPHLWSLWQGRLPVEQEEEPPEMSGSERALALLRRYLDESELAKAFLLALYLERREVIHRCRDLRRKSGRVSLYEVRASGELLHVPRQEQVSHQVRLQEELMAALQSGSAE